MFSKRLLPFVSNRISSSVAAPSIQRTENHWFLQRIGRCMQARKYSIGIDRHRSRNREKRVDRSTQGSTESEQRFLCGV